MGTFKHTITITNKSGPYCQTKLEQHYLPSAKLSYTIW